MLTEDFLVFDLETQRSAEEVGGWQNIDKMLFSVAVIWDSAKSKFFTYYHGQQQELINHLFCGAKVIGFNHLYFDYKVLFGYYQGSAQTDLLNKLSSQNNLDLLIDIKKQIGFRLRLDNIASTTLGVGKSADGLDALVWYKKYKETKDKSYLKKIASYCQQDVKVTKDLYLYGVKNGFIYYKEKRNNIKKIMVSWQESLTPYMIHTSKPDKTKTFAPKLF